jgi:hypothetical protein
VSDGNGFWGGHPDQVSIPSSSGMGVGPSIATVAEMATGLNTFFIRYGCRTERVSNRRTSCRSQYLLHQVWVSDRPAQDMLITTRRLNTFFIRYGCRTLLSVAWVLSRRLNTFFIRYGCRTLAVAGTDAKSRVYNGSPEVSNRAFRVRVRRGPVSGPRRLADGHRALPVAASIKTGHLGSPGTWQPVGL